MPVLITNNHVLKREDIINGKKITFSINNEKYKFEIFLDGKRKRYTNEKYDITFIEIKKDIDKLNINSFLDIDEDIFEENYKDILKNKSIYLLHYPHGNLSEYTSGVIKGFLLDKMYIFKHTCQTQKGSSGSPIINLINHKVIGIHIGYKENNNYNLGTLLKEPINEFYLKKEEKFEDGEDTIQNNEITICEGTNINTKKQDHPFFNIIGYTSISPSFPSFAFSKDKKINISFFYNLYNIYEKRKRGLLDIILTYINSILT